MDRLRLGNDNSGLLCYTLTYLESLGLPKAPLGIPNDPGALGIPSGPKTTVRIPK